MTVSHGGFRACIVASCALICCLRKFRFPEIANRFEMVCQWKAADAIVANSALIVPTLPDSAYNFKSSDSVHFVYDSFIQLFMQPKALDHLFYLFYSLVIFPFYNHP